MKLSVSFARPTIISARIKRKSLRIAFPSKFSSGWKTSTWNWRRQGTKTKKCWTLNAATYPAMLNFDITSSFYKIVLVIYSESKTYQRFVIGCESERTRPSQSSFSLASPCPPAPPHWKRMEAVPHFQAGLLSRSWCNFRTDIVLSILCHLQSKSNIFYYIWFSCKYRIFVLNLLR